MSGIPLHVLVLPSELYTPPRAPLLGIFQAHQAAVLAARGVRTGVVSFGYVPWRQAAAFPYPDAENAAGVQVLRRFVRPLLPARFAYHLFERRFTAAFADLVGDYVRRFGRPDVVHAHNVFHAGLAGAEVQSRCGVPFIVTEHSSAFTVDALSAPRLARAGAALRAAAAVSAVSTPVAREVMRLASPAHASCAVLGNVLDPFLESQARERPSSAAPRAGFVWLAIGSLTPIKNHAMLLSAFARVFRGDGDVRLRIGGQGPLESELHVQATTLGISSQIDWLGRLDRRDVASEMAGCNALAVSSRRETFGVVAIEAMAMGRPVLSTRCGGPEDIVTPQTGLLVENDERSLAEGMAQMRGATFDADAIRRHCLERYGADAFWGRLKALYDGALGRPSAGAPPVLA